MGAYLRVQKTCRQEGVEVTEFVLRHWLGPKKKRKDNL